MTTAQPPQTKDSLLTRLHHRPGASWLAGLSLLALVANTLATR